MTLAEVRQLLARCAARARKCSFGWHTGYFQGYATGLLSQFSFEEECKTYDQVQRIARQLRLREGN